jgi:hypothetical protein
MTEDTETKSKAKAKPNVETAPSQEDSQEVLDAMTAANDAVAAAVLGMAAK